MHALGLPAGKVIKAGDYVMVRPKQVMTYVPGDNKVRGYNSLAPSFRVVALTGSLIDTNQIIQAGGFHA
jgi:hypothetical protein